ncbi:MAG: M23 family metallopeptidase [Treponema sp.]|nr:M23 family metallopeptidase [Treponema sp.]
MNNILARKNIFFLTLLVLDFFAYPLPRAIELNASRLPLIPKISSRDHVFRQYCSDVEYAAKQRASGKVSNQQFYAYKANEDDTLFVIAALCAIPYESIATLNRIEHIDDTLAERILILPTEPGLFVYENPSTATEILIKKKYDFSIEKNQQLWYTVEGENLFFVSGERFSPTERQFFLDSNFKMPLDNAWLSSSYGMRISPITGAWKFHHGIDLAAPEGVPVYACKSGTVTRCAFNDAIYGNYVVVQHNNGISSIYAHLSNITVSTGAILRGGSLIGNVGKTGATTGSHLHLEIRENGVSLDPNRFLQN